MENVILRKIIFKHMDKLRSIFTLVILIVVSFSFTSCIDTGVEDVISYNNSIELTIDEVDYFKDKGVTVGDEVFADRPLYVYDYVRSQTDLFFQLNFLKGKKISGQQYVFTNTPESVVHSVIKINGTTPGLTSLSGTVQVVSDNEIKLIDCVFLEEDTDRKVNVDGVIRYENDVAILCQAKGVDSKSSWIQSFSVEDKNIPANVSDDNGGYGDYSYLEYRVSISKRREFTLVPGPEPANQLVHWKVFIDFNDDGDFSDEGETIVESITASSDPFIEDVRLNDFLDPLPTKNIRHIMRVVMMVVESDTVKNSIEGCSDVENGEVEDYTVFIRDFA